MNVQVSEFITELAAITADYQIAILLWVFAIAIIIIIFIKGGLHHSWDYSTEHQKRSLRIQLYRGGERVHTCGSQAAVRGNDTVSACLANVVRRK
mgnify:CR=1 FL=1